MPNETIHNEIEEWLAADVHDQLADEERAAFEQHLAACTSCRALQEEEKQMHQLLENTLATESADLAFEQRMVRRFRDKLPAPNRGLSIVPRQPVANACGANHRSRRLASDSCPGWENDHRRATAPLVVRSNPLLWRSRRAPKTVT